MFFHGLDRDAALSELMHLFQPKSGVFSAKTAQRFSSTLTCEVHMGDITMCCNAA